MYNRISYNNNNTTKWLLQSVKVARIIGTCNSFVSLNTTPTLFLRLWYCMNWHIQRVITQEQNADVLEKKQAKPSQSLWEDSFLAKLHVVKVCGRTVCVIDAKKVSALKLGRKVFKPFVLSKACTQHFQYYVKEWKFCHNAPHIDQNLFNFILCQLFGEWPLVSIQWKWAV